jgi:hypothetical protein
VESVVCLNHGTRRATFVCEHLVAGSGLGFFEPNRAPISEEESEEQCAWCAACEEVRQRAGGWNDESEALVKITLICDVCFELARHRNASASPDR